MTYETKRTKVFIYLFYSILLLLYFDMNRYGLWRLRCRGKRNWISCRLLWIMNSCMRFCLRFLISRGSFMFIILRIIFRGCFRSISIICGGSWRNYGIKNTNCFRRSIEVLRVLIILIIWIWGLLFGIRRLML